MEFEAKDNKSVLSARIARLKPSPIREILSVASQPGMISFAGGLPADSELPTINPQSLIRKDLQYGPSEGEAALREEIAKSLSAKGLDVKANSVIVLSGSQQGIDLVAKLFIDEGTKIAVESPTYLAALQVFSLFGADYIPYTIDTLDSMPDKSEPSLIYTIPTFQNPSGYRYTREERIALSKFCDEKGVTLFEDDPYQDLTYDEVSDIFPVASYVRKSNWIYQSSFSKTFAPGLRVGYLVCSDELYTPLLRLKQSADLHTCRLSQRAILDLLISPDSETRIIQLRLKYKQRRDMFNYYLRKYFEDLATWDVPSGGLFFWLKLNSINSVNMTEILPIAMESGVTFMPGEPFFVERILKSSFFRLSFSNASPEDMDKGLSILANIIKNQMMIYNMTTTIK